MIRMGKRRKKEQENKHRRSKNRRSRRSRGRRSGQERRTRASIFEVSILDMRVRAVTGVVGLHSGFAAEEQKAEVEKG